MDLNTITDVTRPRSREELNSWRTGDAWLGGGTWLFSEPQPELTRLVDLSMLGWQPLQTSAEGLEIASTCTVAQLDALMPPLEWIAAPLIGRCCRAFLASFKIWNMATVGGNICMSLPAGPMISLTAALDGNAVALAELTVVAGDIAEGRLVRPFELGITVGRDFAYYLVYPARNADDPRIVAFRDWLLAEAAGTQT